VLGVACGPGYGTALLANAGAAQIDGFDYSPEAIAFAKKTWALLNVRVCPIRGTEGVRAT